MEDSHYANFILEKPCPLHEINDDVATFEKDHVGTNLEDKIILSVVCYKQNDDTGVYFKKTFEQNEKSKRGRRQYNQVMIPCNSFVVTANCKTALSKKYLILKYHETRNFQAWR